MLENAELSPNWPEKEKREKRMPSSKAPSFGLFSSLRGQLSASFAHCQKKKEKTKNKTYIYIHTSIHIRSIYTYRYM